MPTVPRYEPAARDEALPNARVSTTGPGVLPVDESQKIVGAARNQAIDTAQKFFLNEKRKGDELAVLDADRKLSEVETDLLYNPETGAMNRKGKDAFGLPGEVMGNFGKQSEEIEKGLSNNEQKSAYYARRSQRQVDIDRQLQRHVSTETRNYATDVTKAFVVNERNAAGANYMDGERVEKAIDGQLDAIVKFNKDHNGLDENDPQVKMQLAEVTSDTYKTVLARMLSTGKNLTAKDYFAHKREFMTAEDAAAMEKAIHHGNLLGEAQDVALQITSKHSNIGTAFKAVDKLDGKDPEVIKEAKSLIRESLSAREAGIVDMKEGVTQEFSKQMEKGKSFFDIKKDPRWFEIDMDQRRALEAKSKMGSDRPTVQSVWYKLESASSHPETRDAFLKTNLLLHEADLSNSDFQELARRQAAIRSGDEKVVQQLDGISSKESIVNGFLREIDIDPTPKDSDKATAAKVNLFREMVDKEIVSIQNSTSKKVTNEQVSEIVKRLGVEGVTKKGWFSDDRKRVFELEPGDTLEVSPRDIPKASRIKIENGLRAQGIPVNDANIIRIYNLTSGMNRANK